MNKEDVLSSQAMAVRVKRWHTWPMIRQNTIGEHSARVALIYVELWGIPRAEVLLWCLQHDLGELAVGDVPSYAKKDVPELHEALERAEAAARITLGVKWPELTDEENGRVKVCDALENWETALIETRMGNGYAEPAVKLMNVKSIEKARLLSADDLNIVGRWMNKTSNYKSWSDKVRAV